MELHESQKNVRKSYKNIIHYFYYFFVDLSVTALGKEAMMISSYINVV